MTLLLAGLSVITVASFSHATVPLYDGVNFPDEPYRYVKSPAAQKQSTPAPTTISKVYQLNRPVYGVYINSVELGPQIYVYIDRSALIIPKGATEFTLSAEPLAPTDQPGGGPIAGNVYKILAATENGALVIANQHTTAQHTIDLRLPQGYPATGQMVFRPAGGQWHALPTSRIGTDIYEANLSAFGEYALSIPNQKSVTATRRKMLPYGLIIFCGMFVVAMTAILLIIRTSERKKSPLTIEEKKNKTRGRDA